MKEHRTDIDLAKIRRFSLIIALILITYSSAGVTLEIPTRIQPLGIPLIIERPNYLAIGLVIASIYSTIKFIYYGMLIQVSPMRAKRRLLSSKLADPSLELTDFRDFKSQAKTDIHRYFPHSKGHVQAEVHSFSGEKFTISFKPTTLSKVFSFFENIDFMAPLLANILALILWIIYFLKIDPRL